MITKAIAIAATYRQEFTHITIKNADGSPARCRVNGKCQTWKTRPNDFKLPVKHGMYDCFYITPANADQWETAGQRNARLDKVNKVVVTEGQSGIG